MKGFLVTILVVNIFSMVHSKCCFASRLIFSLKNKSARCTDFDGQDQFPVNPVCISNFLCGNGKRMGGYYCCTGPSNMMACDCKGGCIPGDVVESFERKYGAENFMSVKVDLCGLHQG
uniref:Uncharacterized protein n=1 Tax=Cacopsylla melanoneura TaxID=428564 RepID=A0A8D9FKB5_9HEMI